jgi:hypothetical protein
LPFSPGGTEIVFGGRQLRPGGAGGQFKVGWIKPGQRLPRLDFSADINQARGQLAADAKSQVELMASPDFTSIAAAIGARTAGWLNQYDAFRHNGRIARLAATKEQGEGKNQ